LLRLVPPPASAQSLPEGGRFEGRPYGRGWGEAYRLIRWTARQIIEPTRTTMRTMRSFASIGLAFPSRCFEEPMIAPPPLAEAALDPFEGGL